MKDRTQSRVELLLQHFQHDSAQDVEEFALDADYYDACSHDTATRHEADLPALTAHLHDLGAQGLN